MAALGEHGGIQLDQVKALDEIGDGYTYFANGDVVVAKITPCFENGKGAFAEGLKNDIAFGTTELHVIRPADDINGRFLFYLSISELFRKLGEGAMYGAGWAKARSRICSPRTFRHCCPRWTSNEKSPPSSTGRPPRSTP